ncbi:MAG: hypothetical protein JXA42_18900 [Anaerolineales bacterium]|nr:hypothetical protein [Anaerolineales bacterium]
MRSALDGAPQQLAGAEDMLLPDVLVEGTRTHAGGEGRFAAHAVVHGEGEEVHTLIITRTTSRLRYTAFWG